MVGLVIDAGRWFYFWLILFLVDLAMGALFRMFAYVLPNMEAAQTAPGPVIALQVVFAGFLVTTGHMGERRDEQGGSGGGGAGSDVLSC